MKVTQNYRELVKLWNARLAADDPSLRPIDLHKVENHVRMVPLSNVDHAHASGLAIVPSMSLATELGFSDEGSPVVTDWSVISLSPGDADASRSHGEHVASTTSAVQSAVRMPDYLSADYDIDAVRRSLVQSVERKRAKYMPADGEHGPWFGTYGPVRTHWSDHELIARRDARVRKSITGKVRKVRKTTQALKLSLSGQALRSAAATWFGLDNDVRADACIALGLDTTSDYATVRRAAMRNLGTSTGRGFTLADAMAQTSTPGMAQRQESELLSA